MPLRLSWPPLAGLVLLAFLVAHVHGAPGGAAGAAPRRLPAQDPLSPAQPVKLIFIHHSTGEAWLADGNGGLGLALRDSNYFVSDTNYGWGPDDEEQGSGTIGDHTDIPDWYTWFTGPHRETYLAALYAENGPHSYYSRLATDPGGPNTVVMFKSCFPNSNLSGNPGDPPAASANNFSSLSVANAKRIYLDLLPYFAAHPEKLFVVIAAPPLRQEDTSAANAANARAFNNWLVNDWLTGYATGNVAVFDFYTVLTTNGGNASTNDLDAAGGNHHRYRDSAVEHITTQGTDYLAYPTGDSHPSRAGNLKATGEFVALLNVFYDRWQGVPPPVAPAITTHPSNATATIGSTATFTVAASGSPAPAYQWQVSTGGAFTDLTNGAPYSNVTTATLAVVAAAGLNGAQYRAVATNTIAPPATTNAATLTVTKLTPVISWANPWSIVYGTALSATQLNATASFGGSAVGGTFVYTPAAETVLNVGAGQTLSVTFTPADLTNYSTATKTVTIDVTNPSSAPVFSDDPLGVGSTAVKAAHVNELRQAIDTLRTRFRLAAIDWTDASIVSGVTLVKAAHLTELRAGLYAVYEVAEQPVPIYTHATVMGGATMITAIDIAELRSAILAIW